MKHPGRWFVMMAMLLLGGAASIGVGAEPTMALDPQRVRWQHLRFEASKLFVTATAAAELKPIAGSRPRAMHLELTSKALGRRSITRLDFDPRTARPDVEERLKIKGEAELRSFHYGERAVERVRYHAEPKAHAARPRDAWREKSRETQPYGGALPVTSPASLLYILSASSLDRVGDRLTIPVFTKGQRILAMAEVVADTEVAAVPLAEAVAAEGQWPGLRLRVGGRGADGQAVDLELFGLDGDLEIVLDRRYRLPVSIRGKMAVVGEVDVRLLGATLAR